MLLVSRGRGATSVGFWNLADMGYASPTSPLHPGESGSSSPEEKVWEGQDPSCGSVIPEGQGFWLFFLFFSFSETAYKNHLRF